MSLEKLKTRPQDYVAGKLEIRSQVPANRFLVVAEGEHFILPGLYGENDSFDPLSLDVVTIPGPARSYLVVPTLALNADIGPELLFRIHLNQAALAIGRWNTAKIQGEEKILPQFEEDIEAYVTSYNDLAAETNPSSGYPQKIIWRPPSSQ